jgi:hypothetical protein
MPLVQGDSVWNSYPRQLLAATPELPGGVA